jgi:hypothetical protein
VRQYLPASVLIADHWDPSAVSNGNRCDKRTGFFKFFFHGQSATVSFSPAVVFGLVIECPLSSSQSPSETAGAVLGALRKHVQDLPWSAARKHMEGRRISVNGILCVDEGRRVVAGM